MDLLVKTEQVSVTVKEEQDGAITDSEFPQRGIADVVQHTLRCELCFKCFEKPTSLRRHLKSVHKVESFSCNFGQEAFAQQDCLIQQHLAIHDSEQSEESYICDEVLTTSSPHGKCPVSHRVPTGACHQCSVCNKTFVRKQNLLRHINVHTCEKIYECPICNKNCNEKGDLTKHLRCHTGEKPFSCHVCGNTFKQSSGLSKHMLIHTGGKFHCDHCGKQFTQKVHWSKHVNVVHLGLNDVATRSYQCEICLNTYKYPHHLKRHLKCHADPSYNHDNLKCKKISRCSACGDTFNTPFQLKMHKRSHNLPRPFTCELCDKTFYEAVYLKQHIKIQHIDEKRFKCGICGIETHFASTLKNHMKSHTGAHPFSCEICGSGFVLKSKLKKHIETHT